MRCRKTDGNELVKYAYPIFEKKMNPLMLKKIYITEDQLVNKSYG